MTDTDFDYPPTSTLTLGVALDDVERELDEAEEGDDTDVGQLTADRDALTWAVGEFGEAAEITLEAFTTTTRSRTIDTLQRTRVGDVGSNLINDWLVAAGVVDAPWLEGGEDLETRAEITGQLPPALTDWADAQLDDLNELSEGN